MRKKYTKEQIADLMSKVTRESIKEIEKMVEKAAREQGQYDELYISLKKMEGLMIATLIQANFMKELDV